MYRNRRRQKEWVYVELLGVRKRVEHMWEGKKCEMWNAEVR